MVTTTYLDSAARLADGWLTTGDLGEVVDDGFRITGRTSDVIISGGENVMAEEVKDALEALESVRAAAVVGIPDETWGEVVAAVVELEADVSLDALSDELRETLAGYKIPKVWRTVDESRSQWRNRQMARKRLADLIAEALRAPSDSPGHPGSWAGS